MNFFSRSVQNHAHSFVAVFEENRCFLRYAAARFTIMIGMIFAMNLY